MKATRNRYGVNKKWTDIEVIKLLDYLVEEKDFEQPTAQEYYRKFLAQSNIEATWKLLRSKVRNLKVSLQNAEAWRKSIDAGLLESASGESAVQAKILRKCPHYNRLKQAFGSQAHKEYTVFESNDTLACDSPDLLKPMNGFEFDSRSSMWGEEDTFALTAPASSTAERSKRKIEEILIKNKEDDTNDSIPSEKQNMQFDGERLEFYKSRLKFEKWKAEQEFALRREELAFKKEELLVKKLEIETLGRVAMHEIEMKYKNKEQT